MTAHSLAVMLADAAHGRFPPSDGLVEVMPSPGPPCDALIAFSGHFVLAADVDPKEVTRRMPPGDFSAPLSPNVLLWLAAALNLEPASHDSLLVAIGSGAGAPSWLQRNDDFEHPRVVRATRYRTDPGVWLVDGDAGEGEPLWAQVAPGNAASMRSTLAAGFVPIGAEVLFTSSH